MGRVALVHQSIAAAAPPPPRRYRGFGRDVNQHELGHARRGEVHDARAPAGELVGADVGEFVGVR